MEQRPRAISKLATYIQDKEPLIYLFIINSDFVLDDDNKVLPPWGLAGVTVKNRRIFFYYKSKVLELPREKLYFLMIHEAFHIFKKHLIKNLDLRKENSIVTNTAEDGIINEEIQALDIQYELKPSMIEGGVVIPDKFKQKFSDLGKNAYTTRRLFYWMMSQSPDKSQLLQEGSYARIDKDGEGEGQEQKKKYGRVTKVKDDGRYELQEMTKDEMFDEMGRGQKKDDKNKSTQKEENLTPVVSGSQMCGSTQGEGEIKVEVIQQDSMDGHLDSEEESMEQEVVVKKLFEKAKEMQKVLNKRAGNVPGGFMKAIDELYKPKVNWRKELNKHLNIYFSNNSSAVERKPSFITYPWNPKSRYGILCKHTIEQISNLQKYVILAIDTSGSIFYDEDEVKIFFTEIEALSKWLDFSKEGKVLTLQWDTQVAEGLKEYKKGDWKRYNLKGGGGTDPLCVFSYLTDIYKEKNNRYVVRENGINFIIPDKKKLPFVIFLTDGYFFNNVTKDNLGVYNNAWKNMLFLTNSTNNIFKEARKIVYQDI